MNEERKDFGKWWLWVIILSVPTIILFAAINYVGVFTGTVVERKVFEQSYQRSEALKSQIATDEAVIAEIKRKLLNPNLDPNTRHNLEAQASAARVRITTARSKQQ